MNILNIPSVFLVGLCKGLNTIKHYLISFIPLILTTPLFGEGVWFGIPVWAIFALLFAVIYASSVIWLINNKWEDLS